VRIDFKGLFEVLVGVWVDKPFYGLILGVICLGTLCIGRLGGLGCHILLYLTFFLYDGRFIAN